MVLSKIDNNINYLETNNLDKNDEGESYAYTAKIFKKNVKFVLGKPNFQYIDNNIVYFNIYLVNNTEIVSKIGIFETTNTSYRDLLDNNGDIIIEKLDHPLFFTYTKTLISNNYNSQDDNISFDEKTSTNTLLEIEEENSDLDSTDESNDETTDATTDATTDESSDESTDNNEENSQIQKPILDKSILLKEQTKEESEFEISNYKPNDSDKWINKFFKSHKYSILNNEGGGDCFFAVLRDALKTLNLEKYKNISVKKIREYLADNLDESQFNTYKEFFDFYKDGINTSKIKLGGLKQAHRTFKHLIGGTNNVNQKTDMLLQAKINLQNILDENDKGKELTNLSEEFAFMTNVKTIDDLRNIIKTNIYWADAWAISTLERLYNVKFIILAEDNFNPNTDNNPFVLQCGEPDKILQKKEIFEPDYYIITNYEIGSHYKLITYDKNINKAAFKFLELPYKIKEEVLEKCMIYNSGLFSLIPDFKNFAKINNFPFKKYTDPILESLVDKPKSQIYDENFVIIIHSRAENRKPGAGHRETITKELQISPNVIKLNKIDHWRRKLDNNWILNKENEKLTINNDIWSSVQHYLYAVRFKLSNLPDIYKKFTINNQETSSSELAKKFYYEMIKLYKSKIISETEYDKNISKFLTEALNSKFNNNEEYKNILKLTGKAKINIYKPGRGGAVTEAKELMIIRELLAK